MMNELIFLLHIITVVGFTLLGLRLGKFALMSLVSLEAVLANLFVVKQMNIFGFNATCADVFVVGSVLGINLLQEYFGEQASSTALRASFFVMFFYLVMSQIHLLYMPNSFDITHGFFQGILKFAPRIIIASILAYFIVLFINNKLYAFLKNRLQGRYLFLRNFISIVFIQLLDTIIFAFLALYGIVGSIWQVIFISFVLKVLVISVSTPFVGISKLIVKNGKS
jgi:queuosine precursor transporter